MEKFLGMSGDGSKKIARSMEKIQTGQVISNIKEYDKGALFWIKQFKDR